MVKTYLGDAVYAEFDGFNVVLTTENGIEVTNTVALEQKVIQAIITFYERSINQQHE